MEKKKKELLFAGFNYIPNGTFILKYKIIKIINAFQ